MRRLGSLLWVIVLGFSLYNWWQIRELKGELEAQRAAVRVTEQSPAVTSRMQRALQRGEHARALLARGRYHDAASELDGAITDLTHAAKATDEETAARLRKVQETLAHVRDQAQGLLHRVSPGASKHSEGG
jgi:hypothetical protein